MGRPKKDENEVKNYILETRLTKMELEILDSIANDLKTTRSRAIRVLINEAESILKNRT